MRLTKRGWNFAQVPVWVLCDPRLDDGAKVLFAYLDWRQGESDGSWPSVARMAADLSVSEDTIQRRLRSLEKLGYLQTEQRAGRSSFYVLNAGDEETQQRFTPRKNAMSQEVNPPQKCTPTPRKNAPPPPAKMHPITIDINDKQEQDGAQQTPVDLPSESAPTSRGKRDKKPQPAEGRSGLLDLTPRVDLTPQTDEERALFRLAAINTPAGRRTPRARFQNVQQAIDFRAAVAVLNGETVRVLEAFYRGGGGGIGKAVAYVCGAARKRQATPPLEAEYQPQPPMFFAPTSWEEA